MSTEHQTMAARTSETDDNVDLAVWTHTTMLDDDTDSQAETNVARGID
jgi:hypothetical protein